MSGEPEKSGEEAAKQDPAEPDVQGAEEPQEIRQDERPAETGIPDEAGARTDAQDDVQADVQDGAQDGVKPDGQPEIHDGTTDAPEPGGPADVLPAPETVWGATPMEDQKPARQVPQAALFAGLVVAVGVAALFAGLYAAGSGAASEEYIDNAIANLELKLLTNRLPTAPQPAAPQAPQAPPPPPPGPPVGVSIADDDPVIGDPAAPIEIVEFSDFQCPFCARFQRDTLPRLQAEYIDTGLAKLIYRDYPIQRIHPNAPAASLASECADDQGAFKGMHDALFERQGEWNRVPTAQALGIFAGYADAIGLDRAAYDACIDAQVHLEEISLDLQEGARYGVTGTPGFFVGNAELGYVKIDGAQPYEVFKQILDAQLGA
ncbi:MAG: DsbA family protein [Nitrosopumilus sp.]|nr:DsbA family protein [Nitrosopumilus sp.]